MTDNEFHLMMTSLRQKYENQPYTPRGEMITPKEVYCHECKQPMIRRKSNWDNGYWWGCSLFPQCRGKKKD